MKIAVTADGPSVKNNVSNDFENCDHLLIVDLDSMKVTAVKNTLNDAGVTFAGLILDNDCEAVITGKIESRAFDIIANGNVTRFLGAGYNVNDSLIAMTNYELDYIRNAEGEDACQENHHEGSCEGHNHDEDSSALYN